MRRRAAAFVVLAVIGCLLSACGGKYEVQACSGYANYVHGSHHVGGRMNAVAAPTCTSAIYRVDVIASLEKRVAGVWVTVPGSPAGKSFYNVKAGRKLTVSTSAPCASGYYRMKAVVKVMSVKGGSLGISDPGYSEKMTRDPCGAEEYLPY